MRGAYNTFSVTQNVTNAAKWSQKCAREEYEEAVPNKKCRFIDYKAQAESTVDAADSEKDFGKE